MMVIEAGAAQNAGLIVFANEATDITTDFSEGIQRLQPCKRWRTAGGCTQEELIGGSGRYTETDNVHCQLP
jgi:hypothetical protein